ncbi:hypothetical protein HDU96_006646 [Phlyctochytrium bullatum]|nr:hypothetical protein HDU96_006646 [Phlyctochytrium bullatum]
MSMGIGSLVYSRSRFSAARPAFRRLTSLRSSSPLTTTTTTTTTRHLTTSLFSPTRLRLLLRRPVTTTSTTTAPKKPGGIRGLMKEYGPVAFITYSLVSAVSLTAWYAAIRLGLDVSRITEALETAKTYLFPPSPTAEPEPHTAVAMRATRVLEGVEAAVLEVEASFVEAVASVADGMKDVLEALEERAMLARVPPVPVPAISSPSTPPRRATVSKMDTTMLATPSQPEAAPGALASFYATHGTTVLMAIAAHNVILPVRVGVTALLTPWVAGRLRAWGMMAGIARVSARLGLGGSAMGTKKGVGSVAGVGAGVAREVGKRV